MTYSPLFPSQPKPILHPFWIATIASVAFHGLLWITLPTRSGSDRPPVDAVDLVQLTPEQLQRLPNLNSPSQLSLPPINPEAWQLPPAPSSSLEGANSAPGSPAIGLPSPRAALQLPPPPVLQLPPLAPPPSYREPLILPTLPPPPSAPPNYDDANPLPVLPPEDLDLEINRIARGEEETQAPEGTQGTEGEEETPPPELPEPTPPAILPEDIPEAAIAELRRLQEAYRQEAEQNQSEVADNAEETLPPEVNPEGETSDPEVPNTESDAEEIPEVDPLLAQLQALQEQIAYNPEGTTREEVVATLESWLPRMREESDSEDLLWNSQELVLALPDLACRYQLQGQGSIGVLVDPEGNVVGEPDLIQSSGYLVLNEAALEGVRTHTFEPTEAYQLYLFKVGFEADDSCRDRPAVS